MGRRGAPLIMPYVHKFTDRHGHVRHYYRRAGKRVPLPGLPGERSFMAAYAAAADAVGAIRSLPATDGTYDHLIAAYMSSADFRRLKKSSQRMYQLKLEKFASTHGCVFVSDTTHKNVSDMIAKMADKPGAANTFIKRFKTLIKFAITRGYLQHDPTIGIKPYKSGEYHTWSEAEIAKFEAYWPMGSRQRLAFTLHLYTGQRRSDVHRMTWEHVGDGRIRVVQQKTGATLSIPIHPVLAVLLDAAPKELPTIISTEHGRPFSVMGYGAWINEAIRKTGLPSECTCHGLRKAAARRLAQAGCSPHQIMAITGHKTLSEIERYTRAADQERLSSAAIRLQVASDRQPSKI